MNSHDPVIKGNIYCSPACGAGCTVEQHEAAIKSAKELADRLGPHWVGQVWENLGWHHKAVCGRAEVHVDSVSGRYSCYLSIRPQIAGHSTDLAGAVGKVRAEVEGLVKALQATLGRELK